MCTQAYYLKPLPRDEFSSEFECNRRRTCVYEDRVHLSEYADEVLATPPTIPRCELTARLVRKDPRRVKKRTMKTLGKRARRAREEAATKTDADGKNLKRRALR